MIETQDRKAKRYFEALPPIDNPREDVGSVVITHFLPGKRQFVDAINRIAPVQALMPKPSSIDHQTFQTLSTDYPVLTTARTHATDRLTRVIQDTSDEMKLVVVDIGGYFADVLDQERDLVQERVAAVIEDTINGEKKYERLDKPFPVPVASVARSPLKLPEDHNVGKAIVFSVDSLARDFDEILHGKRCLVIGYGPVGRGIADNLRARDAYVRVYDHDATARVRAEADGFRVRTSKKRIDDFDFVFCATGGGSLGKDDFPRLKEGCFVATGTSSDEEFEPDALVDFSPVQIHPHVWQYQNADGHSIRLVNNGRSANFIHNAVVGEFIYLVQGEILRLIPHMLDNDLPRDQIITLPDDKRSQIAEKWEHEWNTSGSIREQIAKM